MDNLAVTTATFGTDAVVATGTEYYPHVSQAQIANNTGFNFYRPILISTTSNTLISTNPEDEYPAYLLGGTYTAYCGGWVSDYDAKAYIDGSCIGTMEAGTAAGMSYANGSTWAGTTGWHIVKYLIMVTGTFDNGAVFLRKTV